MWLADPDLRAHESPTCVRAKEGWLLAAILEPRTRARSRAGRGARRLARPRSRSRLSRWRSEGGAPRPGADPPCGQGRAGRSRALPEGPHRGRDHAVHEPKKGDRLDDAPRESVLHSLKVERVHHRLSATRAEDRHDLFAWIETGFIKAVGRPGPRSPEQASQGRGRLLAAPALGAPDPRRRGPRAPRPLLLGQPGEARPSWRGPPTGSIP